MIMVDIYKTKINHNKTRILFTELYALCCTVYTEYFFLEMAVHIDMAQRQLHTRAVLITSKSW